MDMPSENDLLTAELQGPPTGQIEWVEWVKKFRELLRRHKEQTQELNELIRENEWLSSFADVEER